MSTKRDVRDMLTQLQSCAESRIDGVNECIQFILRERERFIEHNQVVASATCDYLAKKLLKYLEGKLE